MTFSEYASITQLSLEEDGYDCFFPSLYILSEDAERLSTLDTSLSEDGEEYLAKEWAASMNTEHLYLAYRAGNRNVGICDIMNSIVVDKIRVHVETYSE